MNVNTKKPVLMQVVPALNFGGVERGTVQIAKAAIQHGFRSIVVTSGGAFEEELLKTGTEVIHLPVHKKDPVAIFLNSKKIKAIINQYGVDIVHARSRAPAWSAYFACKKTNGNRGRVAIFFAV